MKRIATLQSEHSNPTQRLMILRHLKSLGPLTQKEALQRYGIMRLASRIYELRESGFPVVRRMIERGETRFAEYSLAR